MFIHVHPYTQFCRPCTHSIPLTFLGGIYTTMRFHAKMKRFIIVVPVCLHEYDENIAENEDF